MIILYQFLGTQKEGEPCDIKALIGECYGEYGFCEEGLFCDDTDMSDCYPPGICRKNNDGRKNVAFSLL